MALYVTISINDDVHSAFAASRIGDSKSGINKYRVAKYVNGNRVYLKGKLAHKYEDGAVVLAQKVLEFVAEDGIEKHVNR